jgi:hypothetical protein
MIYTKKPVPVLVMKLSDGNFMITDRFNKKETLSKEEFYRYVESKVTEVPAALSNVKTTAAQAVDLLNNDDVAGAIALLEQLT